MSGFSTQAAIIAEDSKWTAAIERSWLLGVFIAAIAYGIESILYVMTCFFLWKSRNALNRRRNLFFIFYTSVIFVLSTSYIAGLFVFLQESFIEGNIASLISRITVPDFPAAAVLANNVMIIKGWLCDIINTWRSIVIYRGCRVPTWLVHLVPILLYLVIIALGSLSLANPNLPVVALSLTRDSQLAFFLCVISLAMEILITVLLVSRILVYRARIVSLLGKAHGNQYTSRVTMIVESAFIRSSVAVLVIIMMSLPNAISITRGQILLLLLSPLQGISTFLIILRVASGKAWSNGGHEDAVRSSTLRFTTRTNYERPGLESSCRESEVSESISATQIQAPGSSSSEERCQGGLGLRRESDILTISVEREDSSLPARSDKIGHI